MGSEANPSPKLLPGEEGSRQLVAVKDEAAKGLPAYFEKEKAVGSVLGADGLPPLPVAFGHDQPPRKYEVTEPSYKDQ
jgi:hypothetical protein